MQYFRECMYLFRDLFQNLWETRVQGLSLGAVLLAVGAGLPLAIWTIKRATK